VYITTNLKATTSGSPASTVYDNMYFHKEAIGMAMLTNPKVESEYNMDLQGELINAKTLFGATILRATSGVVIRR
jgi:hypothetical protein